MKNTIFTLLIIFTILFTSFGQSSNFTIAVSGGKKRQQYEKFYFRKAQFDSTLMFKDTLILSKNRIELKNPRFCLYEDSSFCFIYNIKIDTIRQVDKETGCVQEQIIEYSDRIKGTYEKKLNLNDTTKFESLKLQFKNGVNMLYDVLNTKDELILVRR
ncbi:hypothetical protein OAO55_00585 [Bacteroidales bacterium]|nr:hypothetical protein [Bacteroidales bacterium]